MPDTNNDLFFVIDERGSTEAIRLAFDLVPDTWDGGLSVASLEQFQFYMLMASPDFFSPDDERAALLFGKFQSTKLESQTKIAKQLLKELLEESSVERVEEQYRSFLNSRLSRIRVVVGRCLEYPNFNEAVRNIHYNKNIIEVKTFADAPDRVVMDNGNYFIRDDFVENHKIVSTL